MARSVPVPVIVMTQKGGMPDGASQSAANPASIWLKVAEAGL